MPKRLRRAHDTLGVDFLQPVRVSGSLLITVKSIEKMQPDFQLLTVLEPRMVVAWFVVI